MRSILFVLFAVLAWLPAAGTGAPREETRADRAMWVWGTREYLQDPMAYTKLLDFSTHEGITDLFLQVVLERGHEGSFTLASAETLSAAIRQAGKRGIRIHALDGAPNFALAPRHPEVLDRVQSVLDYNRSVPPSDRFVGIRMDVEPYLLDPWRTGGESQQAVMTQFLSMNRKIADLIRATAPDLTYGTDIPFWFDGLDDAGQPRFAIEFEGRRADLSVHLIRMVDNIGIMAYRNRALGPNSIYALSQGELTAGDRAGNIKVWIGVETKLPDGGGIPEVVTFGHLPKTHLDAALADVEKAAAAHPSFGGFAIHHYTSFRSLTETTADN